MVYSKLKTLLFYLTITIIGSITCEAQVGIGTTSPSAALEVLSTDDGLLIPRVALTITTSATPLTTPTTSEMVYNTATVADVTPGYYFWDGAIWVRLLTQIPSFWSTIGNSGTTAGTNFIGTTDAIDFVTKTNNTEKMRIRSDGSVGINSLGAAAEKLKVIHTGSGNDAINAVNNDDNIGKGNAVWATNSNVTGTSIIASSGATPPNILPTLGAGISGSHVDGYGVYANSGNGDPGNSAHNGHAAGGFLLDNDNSVATAGSSAYAKLAGKDNASPNGALGVQNILYGGYFQGGVSSVSYSYTGIKYNHNASGGGGTDYKVIGNGTASTLIPDENNTMRVMFCPEAPEVLFEDYGVAKLNNGEAYITLDKILTSSMKIDEKHPLKVFIQLEGDCNGVYVTEKSANGFKVKELNHGNSNVSFSWHIVGSRADSKDANGNVNSEFENLRLPIGPTMLKPDILLTKDKNNLNIINEVVKTSSNIKMPIEFITTI